MASLSTQGPAAPDLFSGLLPAASSPVNQSSEAVVGNGSAAGPGSQAITPFQSLQLVHQLKGLIVLLYSVVVVVGTSDQDGSRRSHHKVQCDEMKAM